MLIGTTRYQSTYTTVPQHKSQLAQTGLSYNIDTIGQ